MKMGKNKDKMKEPISIIGEIEDQLGEALSKRKGEIEKELEERIRKEQEEAKKRIVKIEKEFDEEKQSLKSYKDTIEQFENDKSALKNQIKGHLEKAITFQKEIEKLTAQTLDELKQVSDLNHKLENLQKEAEEKATILKKNLEERFGIVADVLKATEMKDVGVDLEQELSKLKRIKELLTTSEVAKAEEVVEEIKEEAVPEEQKAAEAIEEKAEEEVEEKAEEKPEEKAAEEPEEEPEEEAIPEKEEAEPEAEPEKAEQKAERDFQGAFEVLEEFRKSESTEENGEITYFQKNDQMIIDGECLVSAVGNSLDEAKKLYIKLSQTESPKDQFFIKQEIIRHQEALRKVILRSVRMCEKEDCSLPSYTIDILNVDVLKDVLEKLSMENWSNQDDFTFFEKYVKNLKNNYYGRITPPALYLQSIIDELKIE